MGSSTENSGFGPSHNPWDLAKVPGGSSGGSAAAVAAYEAPLALGTDTGGSIRQPAAVCGIVGTKPTYGGISRYGVVAFASSLDTPGPFGRTVLDAALLHEVMSGHDPMDSTSIDAPVPPVVEAARHGDVAGLRIGVVTEFSGDGYQPGVMTRFTEAVELLESLGAKVTEISCPHFKYALPAYYLIAPSEVVVQPGQVRRHAVRAADRQRQRRGGHGGDPGGGLRRGGQAPDHARHLRAVQRLLRRLLRQGAAGADADHPGTSTTAFSQVDVLVSPATPTTAFHDRRAGRRPDGDVPGRPVHDPVQPGGQRRDFGADAGCADEDGLPVGLQVMAPPLADDRLYRVAAAVEAAFTERWGHPLLAEAKGLSAAMTVTYEEALQKYEPVFGLETHVELGTHDQDVLRLPRRRSARSRTRTPARSASACPARCR